jgi:hypothetical protein
MVRAKFKVDGIEATLNGKEEMRTVVLSPVYSNNPEHENSKFFRYTPSGTIRLGTVNPSVWPEFELGQEYYVDFTAAQKTA